MSFSQLHKSDFVCHIECLLVSADLDVGLLDSIRANQGIYIADLNLIELLARLLDLPLVGLDIDDECQCVVALDLLHGCFRGEWVLDDGVVVVVVVLLGRRLYDEWLEIFGLRFGPAESDVPPDLVLADDVLSCVSVYLSWLPWLFWWLPWLIDGPACGSFFYFSLPWVFLPFSQPL